MVFLANANIVPYLECLCGNFILPEPASYVFFYAVFNLRNLLYLIGHLLPGLDFSGDFFEKAQNPEESGTSDRMFCFPLAPRTGVEPAA